MKEDNIGAELRTLNISLLRYLARNKSRTDKKCDISDEATGLQVWVTEYLLDRQDEDVFQKDLEKEFFMRRPTATNFIKKMERVGLITRQAVPHDARLKKIIVTEKALKMQQEMMKKTQEFEKVLRGDLSDEEIHQFIATVQKIKKNIN
ncbi:MarR family transcriptional regulator [Lactococcus hodotermopsidis]|uniref:MarR family transcriptional regulator n=1 Tax=Pseudolactococcus hodotermopsidis TaxID=2709157 RepID=A0A6A0BAZ2_9LACT|nr:MarR family winged helix-turn-helix transcriptional regulator [Lactococcus hodotermopsidis]GFH42599.1 MarR family transcriptional regulator [Lactococcus hodotermopsidis]